MRSELLRNRIVVQRPGVGQDAAGEATDDWVDVVRLWAHIRHPGGLESIKADAPVSVVKASIRIRYRTDITADMRVVHGSTNYSIQAILPDEAGKEFLDLVCETVA